MKVVFISICFLLGTIALAENFQTAKILNVKGYGQGRIAYWEGRVPIYDGYPFYDITVLLGQKKYVVRYESLTGYYPANWKVGKEIRVRLEGKGRMYLLNGDEEVMTSIYNERAQDCVFSSDRVSKPNVGSQVPCD